MKSPQDINILVSGAGIAGLTVASFIQYGFNITLTEKAAYLRKGGQAHLRGTALEVAQKMGILDIIKNKRAKPTGMSVIDAATGIEIYRITEKTPASGPLDSPDVKILRNDLGHILYVNGKARFLFDNPIATLEQDLTRPRVTFTRTAPERFALAIRADGQRPNVRKLESGSDATFVKHLGYYMAVFIIPNLLELTQRKIGYQHEHAPVASCTGKGKDHDIRAYPGIAAPRPLVYNHKEPVKRMTRAFLQYLP